MQITKLIQVIMISFVLLSCSSGLQKGKVIKITSSNIDNYWTKYDATPAPNGIMLGKQSSQIESQLLIGDMTITPLDDEITSDASALAEPDSLMKVVDLLNEQEFPLTEETFVDDEQKFMDMLDAKIESIIGNEPVDIYVNPTFLPAKLAADYDRLWTPERMDRVINVLKNNDVAFEINARYKIPSLTFLHRAKDAGVKFTFGTNNTTNNDLGRLEYCLNAIKELGLTSGDMFLPRPANDKKVLKSGLPAKITG